MFASDTGGNFDALGGWLEGREAFHESATDDGGPAVGGLHDLDGGRVCGLARGGVGEGKGEGEGGADGFAEVGGLAEAADEEDGFYREVFRFGGGDLA